MFKSILRAFRGLGRIGFNDPTGLPDPTPIGLYEGAVYKNKDNADPSSDQIGASWARNVGAPSPYNVLGGEWPSQERYPGRSIWTTFFNVASCHIGRLPPYTAGAHYACFLYQAIVSSAGPGPSFLQVHAPALVPGAPIPGNVPIFTVPMAIQPAFLSVQFPDFGPLYSAEESTNNAGMIIALSSTRDTFTAIAETATFSLNWAYMSERVPLPALT